MIGFLPRSGTYSKPSVLGVSVIASVLPKLNKRSVAGVFSIVRAPSAPVTTLAVYGPSNSAEKRGMIESGESMRGSQKCAKCQASLYFKPTRDRSGPMRRVENMCGMSNAYSPACVTGPQRRVSPVTGRMYWEWQYQQPSRV